MTVDLPASQVIDAVATASHGDAFSVLGPHRVADGPWTVRAWLPTAIAAQVVVVGAPAEFPLRLVDSRGFFCGSVPMTSATLDYRLRISWPDAEQLVDDPFRFGPLLSDQDLWLFAEGKHLRPYEFLGAHVCQVGTITGTRFAVWAPNASRVAVIGDFNGWDASRYPMRLRPGAGIWEIFIPGLAAGELYQFALADQQGGPLPAHGDPYARAAQLRPQRASIISPLPLLRADAMLDAHHRPGETGKSLPVARVGSNRINAPMSVYEVHLPSWRRVPEQDNRFLDWDELAAQLVPYVADMGFTHLELMPVSEHPLDASWGYQPTGLFAPSARFGSAQGFGKFVKACHQAGLSVLLDWVPGHFPADEHGLARFDGTALYEHADPREGFHQDWQSLIYNYGRREVREFLLSNARYWIEQFGLDGLRVDAVASMIYRDYSRKAGEWIPNQDGGRENYEAISLLREMNESLGASHPQVATIAEESTAWPGVSRPTSSGGLGFHYKWNMGWMNDSLRFMARDPAHRRFHLNEMTFSMIYAYDENFVLPLSHDEVVHGKGSLFTRMPGDDWQKFANMRLYFAFMYGHPGKKLLFMGGEFAQRREWNHEASLDWHLLEQPAHRGMQQLVKDLNHLYRKYPALHEQDCVAAGFSWLISDDDENTVLAFVRYSPAHDQAGAGTMLVVTNFTPVARYNYQIGVPSAGRWCERLNTDSGHYGGSDIGNPGGVSTVPAPMHGHVQSVTMTLPPLATLYFEYES